MNPNYLQTIYANEEDRQSARILFVLIVVSCATYLVVSFTGVYWDDWRLISATLAGSILQILPLGLLRRRHLRASSLIFVGSVLGTTTIITMQGQGIHDLAIMAFPSIVLFAGLSLQGNYFKFSVLMTLAAMGWLVFGEANGLFISQPYYKPEGMDFVVVAIILLVAAFGVNLLATNLRQSLELARQEIAQRKHAEQVIREKEVQYRNLADSGIALIWTAGTDKLCNYFNMPWLEFTGRTLEQEMGNGWAEGVHPDDFDRCLETYIAAFDKREAFDMDYRLRHVSGEYRWLRDLGTPNYNSNGEFIGYIGHCFDITERKQAEEQLRYQSTHDAMTGIFNRAFFEAELERFETSRAFPVSVIVADVDKLKMANDTRGHAAGDELLRRATCVLQSAFRAADVLARIGGDEFALLLPNTDAVTAEQLLSRVRAKLAEHNAQHPDWQVQVSFGAATAEKDALVKVFKIADQRMYADKSARQASAHYSSTGKGIPHE